MKLEKTGKLVTSGEYKHNNCKLSGLMALLATVRLPWLGYMLTKLHPSWIIY